MSTPAEPEFVSNVGKLLYRSIEGDVQNSLHGRNLVVTGEVAHEGGAPFEAAIITGYETCRSVLRDDKAFSSHQAPFGHLVNPSFPGGAIAPGTILRYDDAAHQRLRAFVLGEFTARAAERDREFFRQIANEALDALQSRSGVELVSAYAARVPATVTCHLMGLPRAVWDDMIEWCFVVNDLTIEVAARGRADSYLRGVCDSLESSPVGLLGHMARLRQQARLTLDEAVMLSATLLVAGIETTANAIGMALQWLIANPRRARELQEDCTTLEVVCEEFLRFQTVVRYGVARVATSPVELCGRPFRAGTVVIPSLWHANRDTRFLEDGARLDIERPRSRHLSFGHGAHQCLGQHVARAEMRAALHAFVERVEGASIVPESTTMRTSTVFGPKAMVVRWDSIAARWSCTK